MIRVSVVGAFDRFNYGDILFAHGAREVLARQAPEAEVRFYGLRGTDLREQGGVVTRPVREIYRGRGPDRHVVWIAGGDVLAARWNLMAEHLMAERGARLFRRVRRRIGAERADAWCRRTMRVPTPLPWVIDPAHLSGKSTSVVYNSVGGSKSVNLPPDLRRKQAALLNRANWLSVRDGATAEVLEAGGVNVDRISPDSAVTMGRLHSAADLDGTRAALFRRMGRPARGYLALQCGVNYFRKEERALEDAARRIHVEHGLDVVAFTIGRAAGHEDQVASAHLARCFAGESWFREAPHDLTVSEIMALIAGAECYAGTSLHGYITAFVHGRPRVGLSPRVAKLRGFNTDWDLPTMPAGIPLAEAPEAVGKALTHTRETMLGRAKEVVVRYERDMDEMLARCGLASTGA